MRWIWFELPHLSLHNAHKLILVATFQTLLTPLFIAFFFFCSDNENIPGEPQHLLWGELGLKYPRRWETHFGVIGRIISALLGGFGSIMSSIAELLLPVRSN